MRKLVPVLALLAIAGLVDSPAHAGEVPLNNGCQITSNGSVGSSASDTDCTFTTGQWYTFQCDQPVYYRADGTNPDSASPRANFPGDPYPFVVRGSFSTPQPLKVLNVSAAATCNVFKSDG
jgi:hypothetical protein